jgi:hypothetical protein
MPSPYVVQITEHGIPIGTKLMFESTGTLPSPLVEGTIYYVIAEGYTADSFEVSLTALGSAIDTTTDGTGELSVSSVNETLIGLDWSDDGGHTWSTRHYVSIGEIGEYTQRAIWRRLGRSRGRIFRIMISGAVKIVIIAAYAEIEDCAS